MKQRLIAAAAIWSLSVPAFGQTTLNWNNPLGGDWSVPANWSPPMVPGPADTAVLDGAAHYTVLANSALGVKVLSIANPLATLAVAGGVTVTMGGYVGDGLLIVNSDQIDIVTTVELTASAVFDGEIKLNGDASFSTEYYSAFLNAQFESRLGPNSVVSGTGNLTRGVNAGLIVARDGDDLSLFRVRQDAGGVVRVEPGGRIGVYSQFEGGTIDVHPGSLAESRGAVLRDVTILGELGIPGGSEAGLSFGVHGRLVVNTDQRDEVTTLRPNGTVRFDGEIILNADPFGNPRNASIYSNATSAQLTLGPSGVIRGSGQIAVETINEGLILAEAGDRLEIGLEAPQAPTGVLRVRTGGAFRFTSRLEGGTLEIEPGGEVAVGTIQDILIVGDLVIRGTRTTRIKDNIAVKGSIVVNTQTLAIATLQLDRATNLDARVHLNARSNYVDAARISVYQGFTSSLGARSELVGTGAIMSYLTVHGTIAPSGGPDGFGEIRSHDHLVLSESTSVCLDIGEAVPSGFDRITGHGQIDLDGSLRISYSGSEFAGNERLRIIDGPQVAGKFAEVVFTRRLSPTGPEHIVYEEDAVVLVMCHADCDGSSTLDVFDFLCFQDRFSSGDPHADCDGSGSLDVFDFLCFQDAFVTGCP